MYTSLWQHAFIILERSQRVELPNHMLNSRLTVWETDKLFSKVQCHCTFPPAIYECFHFSSSLSTLVIAYLFDYSHSTGYEVESHYGFNFQFPNDWYWALNIGHLNILLTDTSTEIFCQIFLFWILYFIYFFIQQVLISYPFYTY